MLEKEEKRRGGKYDIIYKLKLYKKQSFKYSLLPLHVGEKIGE